MCVGNVQKHQSTSNKQMQLQKKMKLSEVKPKNCDRKQKQYISPDILQILTYYTKVVLILLNNVNDKLQSSSLFKLLSRTTQPAHVITLVAALILAKVLSPTDKSSEFSPPSTLVKLLYLASFAAHFGTQMWMTFVSGLALYLCLPRHTFGDVQKVLFPKYFLINAALSLITLCSFVQCQDDVNQERAMRQIMILVICFCIELTIRLYMTPRLLKLITDKNIMEIQAGVGMEVGQHDAGSLVNSPVYIKIHSTFRKVHMTIAIGNMITMACTAIHLYYLSDKISI